MNKITKQCVAAIASLAMAGTLCVAGAVVAGSSAWAVDNAAAAKAPWEDTSKTGSITINKKDDTSGTPKGLDGATLQFKKFQRLVMIMFLILLSKGIGLLLHLKLRNLTKLQKLVRLQVKSRLIRLLALTARWSKKRKQLKVKLA